MLLAVVVAIGRPADLRVSPRDIPFLAVFGVFGLAMVHYTYFKTISLTNVATAILLEYLAPVLVLIVGVAFMKHKFTWSLPVGVALSIGGSALVVGAIGGEGLVVSPAGILWGLLSAAFFAAYSLMGTVLMTRLSPYTALVWGLGFASLFWLVLLSPERRLGRVRGPQSGRRDRVHRGGEHDRPVHRVSGRAAPYRTDQCDRDLDRRTRDCRDRGLCCCSASL